MKSNIGILSIISLMAVAGIFAFALILVHNGIVEAGKRVEEAESQIAAVCQRRLDLMPNLVETVKGYSAHEKEVLTAVTRSRAQAQEILGQISRQGFTDESMKALDMSQSQVATAFHGMMALVENYPNLRASANFMALQDQFEGTENRIAVARERYNTTVRVYNSKIEKFPGILLAPMFGFEKAAFFQAQPEAATQVKAAF
jgi:LemA protein